MTPSPRSVQCSWTDTVVRPVRVTAETVVKNASAALVSVVEAAGASRTRAPATTSRA